jgi:uncharacterized membrane protein YgcG
MRHVLRTVAVAAALLGLLSSRRAEAAPPVGNFDSASCDVIAGWSQDPDEPAKAIAVHLYFGGPAGSGAPGVPITANVYRGDLCTAIGSCEHGFAVLSPLSLHDGQPRDIHAYGIDSQGGTNPEIGLKTMSCPPEAPTGIRRKVDGATVSDAWQFSTFWDLLPLGEGEADALPEGPALTTAPALVQSDDGSATLWLVEGGLRREVSPEAKVAWHLDSLAVETRPAAMVSALVEGSALRPRPVVFLRGGLYLVDDPQPAAPIPTSSSSGVGGGGSGGGGVGEGGFGGGGLSGEGASSSCGCAVPGAGEEGLSPLGLAGFLLALISLIRGQRALR